MKKLALLLLCAGVAQAAPVLNPFTGRLQLLSTATASGSTVLASSGIAFGSAANTVTSDTNTLVYIANAFGGYSVFIGTNPVSGNSLLFNGPIGPSLGIYTDKSTTGFKPDSALTGPNPLVINDTTNGSYFPFVSKIPTDYNNGQFSNAHQYFISHGTNNYVTSVVGETISGPPGGGGFIWDSLFGPSRLFSVDNSSFTVNVPEIIASSITYSAQVNISSSVLLTGSAGTSGQFLQSNGPDSVPTWGTATGGGGANGTINAGNTHSAARYSLAGSSNVISASAVEEIGTSSVTVKGSFQVSSNTVLGSGTTFYQNGPALIDGATIYTTWPWTGGADGQYDVPTGTPTITAASVQIFTNPNQTGCSLDVFNKSGVLGNSIDVSGNLYNSQTTKLSAVITGLNNSVVNMASNTMLSGTTFYQDGRMVMGSGTQASMAGTVALSGTVYGTTLSGNFWRSTTNGQLVTNGYDLFGGTQTFTGQNTFQNQVTVSTSIWAGGTGTSGQVLTSGGANAAVSWTTPTGGGGASALAVTTGTSSGFSSIASSPTAVINFDNAQFSAVLAGSATGYVKLLSTQTFAMLNVTSNTVLAGTTFYADGTISQGGSGNTTITEPNGFSGQVWISTSVVPTGHVMVAGSSITVIDGGIPGTGGSGGSGIVSPGTFTWTNSFGIGVSTIQVSSNTILANTTFYQDGRTVATAGSMVFTGSGGITNTYNLQTGSITLSAIATPVSAGAGTIWNDSAYNAFVSSTTMGAGYIARYVWVATSTVTNQNLASGTTFTTNAGAGSNSNFGNPLIPPSYLTIGKTFVFTADGYYGTDTVGPKLQWEVKLGTFTVCDTGAAPLNSVARNITSSAPVHMNGQITVRSTGITGSVFGQCSVIVASNTTTTNIQVMPTNKTATTVDTTIGNMFNIVATWSAASARNLVAITNAWIREQD